MAQFRTKPKTACANLKEVFIVETNALLWHSNCGNFFVQSSVLRADCILVNIKLKEAEIVYCFI